MQAFSSCGSSVISSTMAPGFSHSGTQYPLGAAASQQSVRAIYSALAALSRLGRALRCKRGCPPKSCCGHTPSSLWHRNRPSASDKGAQSAVAKGGLHLDHGMRTQTAARKKNSDSGAAMATSTLQNTYSNTPSTAHS